MHINENGITLKECPLCGSEVRIESGYIVCGCGITLRINNHHMKVQEWIDMYWNERYCDSEEYAESLRGDKTTTLDEFNTLTVKSMLCSKSGMSQNKLLLRE